MDKYDKSFLMLYRGSNESNVICSATKNTIDIKKVSQYIDINYLNLDKRNLVKNLKDKDTFPDIVYVWYEEEDVIDYLVNNYPNIDCPDIEIRIYNRDNSYAKETNDYVKKGKPTIASDIITEYIKAQGTLTFWINKEYKPALVEVNKYDYNKLSDYSKQKYFLTEQEALLSIKKCLEKEIQSANNMIVSLNERKQSLGLQLVDCLQQLNLKDDSHE